MADFFAWLSELLCKIPFIADLREAILAYIENMMIMHYGCPNSKRTAKLQLKKQLLNRMK